MSGTEKLSARQIQLIQGSAAILMDKLYLSKEQAMSIISESLREQLKESNVMFEFLEIGTISYRQVFLRKLVQRVEAKINSIKVIQPEKIRGAIDAFVKMLYESWSEQGAL